MAFPYAKIDKEVTKGIILLLSAFKIDEFGFIFVFKEKRNLGIVSVLALEGCPSKFREMHFLAVS